MTPLPQPFGRYLLLKQLGSGGTGDVHLARPLVHRGSLPMPVVIKRLHARLEEDETFVQRFQHEARLAVEIDSPVLARVYDCGRVGSTLYMVQEHIAGWPLSQVLHAMRAASLKLSFASAIAVVTELLDGLEQLHTAKDRRTGEPLGVVHRDISPKNIMLDESGRPRLIDLGLGRSALQEWRTKTGIMMGTMGYMPPEQLRGTDLDHRADIYAVGTVLYELLTLRPFIERGALAAMLKASLESNYRPIAECRIGGTAELENILRRALAVKPEQRFASAKDFAVALRSTVLKDSDGLSAPALVRTLFGDELEDARTEVTRLLSTTAMSPARAAERPMIAEPQVEEMVVFAERLLPPSYPPVPFPAPSYPTGPLSLAQSQPFAPPSNKRWVTPVLVVVFLGVGVVVGQRLGGTAGVVELQPVEAIEVEAPKPIERPQVTARPQAEEETPPEEPDVPEDINSLEAIPKAPSTRAPKKERAEPAVLAPSKEPSAAEKPAQLSAKDRARALIARTRLLRERLGPESDAASDLGRILARLVLEAGAADEARAQENLDRLEAELRTFEAR